MRPLSYTSLTSYETCPLKWRFEYVDKLPVEPRWYHGYGQSVHAALELMGTHDGDGPPPLDAVVARFEEAWSSDGFQSPVHERAAFEKGARLLRAFYVRHAPTWRRPAAVEHFFLTRVDDVPVRGFIDRIDRLDDGSVHIIDYKSGRTSWTPERVAGHDQLTLYQLAIENEWGATVDRLSIYHLPTQRTVSAPPKPPEDTQGLRRRLKAAAGGIGAKLFPPRPGDHCRDCDFHVACPAYPPDRSGPLRGQTSLSRHWGFGADDALKMDEDPS